MTNTANTLVRALLLYHLTESQVGSATTIHVSIQNHTFEVSDNGRGHAVDRTINGLPYLRLVYSHLEYPFELDHDTPIQLHTIGMSMINSFCHELTVTVHKKEKIHIQYYKNGHLEKEDLKENQENITGTTVEGKIDTDLIPGKMDLQDIEQWLIRIKSINKPLKLFFNGREL